MPCKQEAVKCQNHNGYQIRNLGGSRRLKDGEAQERKRQRQEEKEGVAVVQVITWLGSHKHSSGRTAAASAEFQSHTCLLLRGSTGLGGMTSEGCFHSSDLVDPFNKHILNPGADLNRLIPMVA